MIGPLLQATWVFCRVLTDQLNPFRFMFTLPTCKINNQAYSESSSVQAKIGIKARDGDNGASELECFRVDALMFLLRLLWPSAARTTYQPMSMTLLDAVSNT